MKIPLPSTGRLVLVCRVVKFFPLIFAFFSFSNVFGQRAMQFTEIPITDPEIRQYDRGAEDWNFMEYIVDIPAEGRNTQPRNLYFRYKWWKLEPSQGVYDFSQMEQHIRQCMENRQRLSIGIMHLYLGDPENPPFVDGHHTSYPVYLHQLMQSEPVNSRDYVAGNWWIPNLNSPNYLARFDSLHANVYRFLNNNYYRPSWASAPIKYKDIVNYIDIRGKGNWGEWNTVGYHSDYTEYPPGRLPTYASLKRIVQSHTTYFPDIQLVAMIAAFDCQSFGNTWNPPALARYLADTAQNARGRVGIRRDDWGDNWWWFADWTYNNTKTTIRDTAVGYFIGNMWKYAPIVGEPASDAYAEPGAGYAYFPGQIDEFHVSSFGEGNYYGGKLGGSMADYFREASKRAGYRVVLTGGSVAATLQPGAPFTLTVNWQNKGVAPVYHEWIPYYELRNASNQTIATWKANWNLRYMQPSTSPVAKSQILVLPANIPSGTYSMRMIIRDSLGYAEPFILNVQGRAADGSYLLADNITVGGTAVANTPPTANAGADQVIALPTNTATLTGSGNDPDGDIASYAWTKVSGPAGGAPSSPNTASTTVTGLVQGTYVYRLTVTDNLGATATDDVQITVSAAPAPAQNTAPVANAGPDRAITLPTNTATLNGSGTDADGTIASYRWAKVSGPAGGTIASPNAATTAIDNLIEGTYVYRLTVTDNDGATDTDDVSIVVSNSTAPSPTNQPPVANAGADRNITLPTNALTLTGTATDADGSVATYAWSKVSGPSGGNIQSPNTASTQITAMIAGTYVFRLTVTDNNGAVDTDDVQVVVNPATAPAGNQAPIANAGTNITITLPTSAATLNGSGTDPDGTIAGYSWAKVSGPAGGTIQSPTSASTQITGMIAGTYVFRLTVRDNLGAQGTDDVQIVVNPAPVAVNQAPIANAGRDISITLPVDSAQLNGSASRDPDGSIASYSWRKVSGPTGGTLNNPRIANPVSQGMKQGIYEFELLVTDNRGATHTDRVTVTVIRINKRPVLATIDTVNVMLPVQNTELSAVDSYDPDGTITSYQWAYVSGPSTPRVLNPRSSRTVVADLLEGTYRFRIEATDNDGEKSAKAVVVIVSPNNGRRIVPEVDVYPNPAASVVNIQVTSELNGRTMLTFYDMNGRPVMTDVFTKATRRQTRQVNIARLPKGAYGVVIQVDQAERVVEKLIKF